ncbi:MAG: Fe-S-containing hydro-lyase [Candidatus Desulfofervidaceae bacterium]|nr:Fe-S-containing hydro-lyase [Candidatus Desulfofervidaceae bacterium]
MKRIKTPLTDQVIETLKVGDKVLLSGVIYTARDAAHRRIIELFKKDEPLPFNLQGNIIYYVGPTPALPGRPIGAAGPTTSSRMDPYAPLLLEKGLKGMIGKGKRSLDVIEAIKKFKGVYFVATGGAGALLSECIKEARVIAYPELGAEAIYELRVEDLPLFVANDIYGNDIYEIGKKEYQIAPCP